MLRDLTIQNYRTFKDFQIDGLARVNLIVGMNNSGKTSLLEAVYLLVNQGQLQCLIDLLNSRGEMAVERFSPTPTPAPSPTPSLSEVYLRTTEVFRPSFLHIFYGHKLSSDQAINIQSQKEDSLSFRVQPHATPQQLQFLEDSEYIETDVSDFELVFSYGHTIETKLSVGSDGVYRARSSQLRNLSQSAFSFSTSNSSLFLTTSKLSFEQLAVLWNGIILTPKEDKVVEALQILEPAVERIGFTSHQTPNSGIILKLRGQDDPVPLGSMGEGMRRMLTLAMAAVTVDNGFLLVDEIDTGLYYETQTDMWRLLLEIAQRLNVQIFATTHSWDCICAFQEALAELEDRSAGKLFRLSQRDEKIRPIAYTADELAIAVPHSIEVR